MGRKRRRGHRLRFKPIFAFGFPISDFCFFLEHHQRQRIAVIQALSFPIQDLLGGIEHPVGTLLRLMACSTATLPIHQRPGTAHTNDFGDDIFRVGFQRRAEHIGIFHKFRQRLGEEVASPSPCGQPLRGWRPRRAAARIFWRGCGELKPSRVFEVRPKRSATPNAVMARPLLPLDEGG